MKYLSEDVAYFFFFFGDLYYSKWDKPVWQLDGTAAVTGDR